MIMCNLRIIHFISNRKSNILISTYFKTRIRVDQTVVWRIAKTYKVYFMKPKL
jgi:hypothetical protein